MQRGDVFAQVSRYPSILILYKTNVSLSYFLVRLARKVQTINSENNILIPKR